MAKRVHESALHGEVEIKEGITYRGSLDVMRVPGMDIGACFAVIPGTNLGTKRFSSIEHLRHKLRQGEVVSVS